VDPRVGLDDVEKILDPTRTRTPTLGRPARSQSLYRLRYPRNESVLYLLFPVTCDIKTKGAYCGAHH
jgi:hypothetical protein